MDTNKLLLMAKGEAVPNYDSYEHYPEQWQKKLAPYVDVKSALAGDASGIRQQDGKASDIDDGRRAHRARRRQ